MCPILNLTSAQKLIFKTFFCFLFLTGSSFKAQFTAGNLVVLQAGDGSIPLANTGNRIMLREFTPLGVTAFSVAITSTLNPLIISGTATSEGMLSLSSNGKYLVFGGYAATLPYGSSLSAATSAILNRGIGILDAAGNYSRVAINSTLYSGSNIRGAASDGLANYWGCGGSSGTGYFGTTASSVLVQNAVTNTRYISSFSGNLYFSTGSGTQGIYKIGSGFPITSGQSNSLIINTSASGIGSASCFAFYFNAAQTICYVADDRSFANGGGVQKWIFNNGAWSIAYVLNVGGGSGARGVVADFSGANPLVYATTDESSSNRLVAVNDAGAASTATTLSTASANTIFRGLAFSPYCTQPQINSISPSTVCLTQQFVLTPSLTGTQPFSYTWTAPNSNTVSSPFINGVGGISGTYSLSVSNGCGSATAVHSLIVNPLPNISVNSPGICPGGTVTLIANGASTYTWDTSANTNTINVSPATTTTYTVSGTSLLGCMVTATTSVIVSNSLVASANSASICPGSSVTLTLTGAYGYTIVPPGPLFATTGTINVSPLASTVYSIFAWAPGCQSPILGSCTVVVYPPPAISVNSETICAGNEATLTVNGGMNYSWSSGEVGPQAFTSPTVNTNYTVTGSSVEGCIGSATAQVIVNPLPTATLTVPGNSICMNGGPQTLTGTPQGGFYSGTAVGGDQFIPSAAGEGTVVLSYRYTDGNNCSFTDSKTVTVISCTFTTLNELAGAPEISIYPIPSWDHLTIERTNFGDPFAIEITNDLGTLVREITFSETKSVIFINELVPGIYFIKIKSRASPIFKFIKE